MENRHFTAWMCNDPSCLDTPFMDVTVLEDMLVNGDPEKDSEWSSDSTKPVAFFARTTVDAKEGDAQAGIDQAEELMSAAGWRTVGGWDALDTAYVCTVVKDED